MPSPARRSSAEIVWYEIRKHVDKMRTPLMKIGTEDEYRAELVAQSYLSFLEHGGTVVQVCDRTEGKLSRQYRELRLPGERASNDPKDPDDQDCPKGIPGRESDKVGKERRGNMW